MVLIVKPYRLSKESLLATNNEEESLNSIESNANHNEGNELLISNHQLQSSDHNNIDNDAISENQSHIIGGIWPVEIEKHIGIQTEINELGHIHGLQADIVRLETICRQLKQELSQTEDRVRDQLIKQSGEDEITLKSYYTNKFNHLKTQHEQGIDALKHDYETKHESQITALRSRYELEINALHHQLQLRMELPNDLVQKLEEIGATETLSSSSSSSAKSESTTAFQVLKMYCIAQETCLALQRLELQKLEKKMDTNIHYDTEQDKRPEDENGDDDNKVNILSDEDVDEIQVETMHSEVELYRRRDSNHIKLMEFNAIQQLIDEYRKDNYELDHKVIALEKQIESTIVEHREEILKLNNATKEQIETQRQEMDKILKEFQVYREAMKLKIDDLKIKLVEQTEQRKNLEDFSNSSESRIDSQALSQNNVSIQQTNSRPKFKSGRISRKTTTSSASTPFSSPLHTITTKPLPIIRQSIHPNQNFSEATTATRSTVIDLNEDLLHLKVPSIISSNSDNSSTTILPNIMKMEKVAESFDKSTNLLHFFGKHSTTFPMQNFKPHQETSLARQNIRLTKDSKRMNQRRIVVQNDNNKCNQMKQTENDTNNPIIHSSSNVKHHQTRLNYENELKRNDPSSSIHQTNSNVDPNNDFYNFFM